MIEFGFENVSDCVFHHAARRPDRPALIYGRESVSYARLATLVGQAAMYAGGLGINAGDRVGIAMTNCIERVVISLALMRIGAVVIEMPTEITAPLLAGNVTRLAITATFVEAGGPTSTARIAVTTGMTWLEDLASFTGDARYQGDPGALKLIILSSGSTGTPKGTVITHRQRNVRSSYYANATGFYSEADPGTLVLAAPANTSLVSQFLTTHLMLGGPVVLLPVLRYGLDLVREIAACPDAICPLPPGLARSFLPFAPASGVLFPNMRALVVSGQPLASHDKVALTQRVSPNLYDVYGCAGLGLIACIGPDEVAREMHSVGRPIAFPGVEIEIAGHDGRAVKPGMMGQLRVRGPNMALGFFNPQDNERGDERFVDGWYYPGEVALMTKGGYLILEGRIADAIRLGALTVYPPEIEDVITQHPHVVEAAVVGRPGAGGVEDLVAFVVGKAGFRHQDIDAYCRSKLPSAKRPKYIYYLDHLPKTGNGKLDRPALKAAPLTRIDPL